MPSTSRHSENSVCTATLAALPEGDQELLSAIESCLPSRVNLYLQIIASSRLPPTRTEFFAAAELAAGGVIESLEADLLDLDAILDSIDPFILSGAWRERCKDNLEDGHALWAGVILNSGCDSVQTLVQLAYHLAHSKGAPFRSNY